MTETRKKIIKLIEPYMDKTLSFGCIFYEKFHWKNSEYLVWNKIISRYEKGNVDLTHYIADYSEGTHLDYISTNTILNLRQYKYGDNHKQDGEKVYKILGHYDITAVLKYINKYFELRLGETGEYFELYNGGKIIDSEDEYLRIPNKSLTLYTQQEEKDLLELLQQL